MLQQNQNLSHLNLCDFEEGKTVHIPTQNYPDRRFKLIKMLGEGTEGVIFQAESINWWLKAQYYALKIHKTSQKDEYTNFIKNIIAYQNSQENSNNSSHSYLIRTYESFYISQNILVVIMEFGGQNLYDFFTQNRNIDLKQISDICLQMAQSIYFLVSNNFIHRDIKPENYVIIGGKYIKLIDFGLIKNLQHSRKTTRIGTPYYQAPELVQGRDDYTSAVDIWSLGCVFFELIKKEPLFNFTQPRQISQQILKHLDNQSYVNERINQLQISNVWKQIIQQMLNPQPQRRPKIAEIITSFQQNDISSGVSGQNQNAPPNYNTSQNQNVLMSQNGSIHLNAPIHQNIPINQNTQMNQNAPLNQNVFQQINNLMFTFQNQAILNQLRSSSEAQEQIQKLINQSNEVIGKSPTNIKQSIEDKLTQAQQLISEIEQDKEYQNSKHILLSQFSELQAKKEIILQDLQAKEKKQSEINNLENEINDEQKLKEQLFARLKQKTTETENQNKAKQKITYSSTTVKVISEQEIQKQQQKLIDLKIQLNKSIFWENTYKQNLESIKNLEKQIQDKKINESDINEQTKQLVQLELDYEKTVEYQKKYDAQSQEIEKLQAEIDQLKQKFQKLADKEQQKKLLSTQINYLNKEIQQFAIQEKDLEEQRKNYQVELKKYEEQKGKQNQQLQEIEQSINQLTLKNMELETELTVVKQREQQKINLLNEIENKKKTIERLNLSNIDVETLVKQNNSLDLTIQQKTIQQQVNPIFATQPFASLNQRPQNQPGVLQTDPAPRNQISPYPQNQMIPYPQNQQQAIQNNFGPNIQPFPNKK